MPRPALIGTRHEIFALASKGMHQSDIAAKVGVARKNVNHILLRQAATASLKPGKPTGAPRKTIAGQERAFFIMVHEDHVKSDHVGHQCVLAVRRLTTDLWPEATMLAVSRGSPYWRPRPWLWLLGSMPSREMSHVFRCTLSMAAWEFVNRQESAYSKTARLLGFRQEGVLSVSGGRGCQISTCVPG